MKGRTRGIRSGAKHSLSKDGKGTLLACAIPSIGEIVFVIPFIALFELTVLNQLLVRSMESQNSSDATSIRRFATLESHLDPGSEVEKENNFTATGKLPEINDWAESQLPTTSKLILLAACLTFSNIVSSLLSGSVTVILDDLAADLHIEENNLQWAFNSAQLPFGCFILVAGKAADIGGRKRTFVIGSVLSSVMNLVAGFMRNEIGFYVCRALGGLAGSLVAASNMGILAENTVPGKLRSLCIGISIAGFPFGGALGLVISGPLAESSGWRSMFYLVAGLTLLPLLGILLVAKSSKPTGELVDKRIDWLGGFMFTSGSVLLFFCLSQALSAPEKWATPYIIGLLVSAVVLLTSAVVWVRYLETNTTFPPIMRPSIVTRNRGKVAAVYAVVFCCMSSYSGLAYTSTIFYQRYKDFSPTQIMLRYLPGPVVGVICNISVGLLSAKVQGTWFFLIGSLCTAIANVLYATMDEAASYWKFEAWGQALCVVGPDLVASMGYIYITNVVDLAEVAVAGASLQFVIAFAYTPGHALSTVTYTSLMGANHGGSLNQEETKNNGHFVDSLRSAFWLWAGLCFAAVLLTLLFLRDMNNVPKKGDQPKDEELARSQLQLRDRSRQLLVCDESGTQQALITKSATSPESDDKRQEREKSEIN